jgi:hypothetical protein
MTAQHTANIRPSYKTLFSTELRALPKTCPWQRTLMNQNQKSRDSPATDLGLSRSHAQGAVKSARAWTQGSVVLEQHFVLGRAGVVSYTTQQLPPSLPPCRRESQWQGHQHQRYAISLEMHVWEAGVLSSQGRCLTCYCAPCSLLSASCTRASTNPAHPHSMPHFSTRQSVSKCLL